MYVLYKVEVWIKANIERNTPLKHVLQNIDNIPSGKVDFIEIEDYITKTEKFIPPTKEEATLKLYSEQDHLIYSNQLLNDAIENDTR
jgi:hypothetical protein